MKAVSGRPAAWRADLAVRLAKRIRRPDDRIVPLALALLRDGEVTPPDHEPLVAAWLSAVGVAEDPLTPHLLPKIFDAAGAGPALVSETLTPKPSRWLALAARRAARDQVIEGCVRRFLLGGDARDLRFFVRLHARGAHAAGVGRAAARLSAAAARRAGAGGRAGLAAGAAGGARSGGRRRGDRGADVPAGGEARRKGLTWLDRELATAPERVADHLTALTNAYAHASHEVRDRAVTLALSTPPTSPTPAPILEAAGLLPPSSARPDFERFRRRLNR